MYGNTSFGVEPEEVTLTPEQRNLLRRDLSNLAARMRDVLPPEFVVGSEITNGQSGPRATIAIQPPLGGVVSADFTPEDGNVRIEDEDLDDIVHSLAASAALQVKQAMGENDAPVAQ